MYEIFQEIARFLDFDHFSPLYIPSQNDIFFPNFQFLTVCYIHEQYIIINDITYLDTFRI